MTQTIYTVGHEEAYDRHIQEHREAGHPENFTKKGRHDHYDGGCAFTDYPSAERFIEEQGQVGKWAVYELDADGQDLEPHRDGWWYYLLADRPILRKVPAQTRPIEVFDGVEIHNMKIS